MTLEEYKKEVDKNIKNLFNKANEFEKILLSNMVDIINNLCEEKQKLIDYLKEQITLCDERIDFHKSEISGVTNISDNNRHLILIKENKIRKESFEEILSKIEKE